MNKSVFKVTWQNLRHITAKKMSLVNIVVHALLVD